LSWHNGGSSLALTPLSIKIRPSVLHQARIAAVIQNKALGQWLEDAIIEQIKRESIGLKHLSLLALIPGELREQSGGLSLAWRKVEFHCRTN